MRCHPVPSGAVPCPAVRCGAVPCCAMLSFEDTVPGIMRSTRYQVPVCSCVLFCLPSSLIVHPLGPVLVSPTRKSHSYCQSECDIANKHKALHRAISSAQVALGITKSLVAPNHGPLLSAPFAFSCVLPYASVPGGVSRLPSGALCISYSSILMFRSSGDCARPKLLDKERWSQTLAGDGLWRLARSCG